MWDDAMQILSPIIIFVAVVIFFVAFSHKVKEENKRDKEDKN
jgi:hypothetical protein